MRNRIIEELGDLPRSRFLVYLMGPYQAFDVEQVLDTADPTTVPESIDFGTLVESNQSLDRDQAALNLLLEARDHLRTSAGVNAYLAIDVDVSLDEMDAASQSIAFARASNVVAYVVPTIGDNLGVGIEVGSVLESLFDDESPNHCRERVLFVHESGVRSAMIAAVRDRWEARIYAYENRDDLFRQLRLFVRDVIRKEQTDQLPRLE
ncbi:DUF7509 family protein [Natrarchaeobaculum aegyptiacum]|uniref:DUF7509 domain-containing protein n=1 Tax=Natrarchaeobaculum aegyptiacum TaxID=745377 RepID=A0A2Z2HYP8_9EURY|nr:hypothetical protein [Natrarchaeobaculum aegyptiacum]ARS90244.1 hypothetical protein B1756_11265 [Natrarchaeobaculum aegyptiacum]